MLCSESGRSFKVTAAIQKKASAAIKSHRSQKNKPQPHEPSSENIQTPLYVSYTYTCIYTVTYMHLLL